MLFRQVIGYFPALVFPAVAAFGAIYCYTRLLSPADFGNYSLALSTMALLNAMFFSWLRISLPRLAPEAIRENRLGELRATAQLIFAGITLLLLAGGALIAGVIPLGHIRLLIALAVPLALARSLLNLNQAFHRSALEIRSYSIIECGQAVLSLGFGVSLVYFAHLGDVGAVAGMIFGMAAMAIVDLHTMLSAPFGAASRRTMSALISYSLPLVGTMGFNAVMTISDRYLIDYFRGAEEVGFYAAGSTLVIRIIQIIFDLVATPAFPLVVHRLENEGVEGARAQTYTNGVAILALILPACTGLIMTNRQIATVFIGPEFRSGAIAVMPWIVLGTGAFGIASHFFDHAFHLAKKPHLLWFTRGPAAAFSLCANLVLIPRYGFVGAAWSVFASYMVVLILTVMLSPRGFPLHFPFRPALKIAASTAIMAGALVAIPFPADLLGLAAMVTLGVAVYGTGLVAFDVLNIRMRLMAFVRR